MCILHPGKDLTPGGRVLADNAAEGGFEMLIGPLSLTIGLRMEARRQVHCGTYESTEGFPKTRGKLRTPVGDHRGRQAMYPEDMLYQELSSFLSCGQFRQRNVMNRLRKTIYNSKDNCVTIRVREASDKVQGYVRPGPARNGQWL